MSKTEWQREAAMAAGKPTYSRLKLCKRKHYRSEWHTATGQCVQCMDEFMARLKGEAPPLVSRGYSKQNGYPRFYEGKPCRYGHMSERYTKSGACVECSRIR